MPVMPASDQQIPPFLNMLKHECVQDEKGWLDGRWRLGFQQKYDWQLVLGGCSDDYQVIMCCDTQTEAATVAVGDGEATS